MITKKAAAAGLGALLLLSALLFGCSGGADVEKLAEKKNVKGLIRVLGYDEWRTPDQAYEALLEIGEDAVDELIGAIDHKNDQISAYAMQLLGEIKDPRAIDPLIEALDDPRLEENALYALCRFGDIDTLDVLMDYADEKVVAEGGLVEINVKYVEPVITGRGVDAAPYNPEEPGPHPVVITDSEPFKTFRAPYGDRPTYSENWNAFLPTEWQPLGDPGATELVLCWGEVDEGTIESAVYRSDSGTSIRGKRVVEKREVILREAATGEIVASDVIRGETPEKFPSFVSNFGGDFTYKGEVTAEIIIEWLRAYVEGGAE